MEKNYISELEKTCFYVDLIQKEYGVCINIKDIDKKNEIMDYFYKDEKNKKNIEAWKNEWKVGTN